jgi:hypothetical protein
MTDRCEKRDQFPQLPFIEMAELFAVNVVNPVLHLVEQVQPGAGNAGDYIAPVLAAPLPDDQFRIFEAIEKPRDVRHLPHQSIADFMSAKTLRLRPAQNPKDVVLGRRNPVRLQGGLEGVLEQRRCPLDAEVRLLFQALERPGLFQFCLQCRGHAQILRVITRIVNTHEIAQIAVCHCATDASRFEHESFPCFKVQIRGTRGGAIGGCASLEHFSRFCCHSRIL